ncbi:hypothetical protein ACFOKJ_16645 [Vogesella amnigena]|uniref:Uncharacterized protein n=1 Tax=Vogesella amnigena TaxID=1507449 RepID=A0ABV7TYN9_9NEIS
MINVEQICRNHDVAAQHRWIQLRHIVMHESVLDSEMNNIFSSLMAMFVGTNEQFEPGLRVNYVPRGYVEKFDGTVVACDRARGVLVAWPRGGADWLPEHALAVIG